MKNLKKKLSFAFKNDMIPKMILPLLKINKTSLYLTIGEASTILSHQLQEFLQETHADTPLQLESMIQTVKTYFQNVKNGTLYTCVHHTENIQKILITLSEYLLDTKSKSDLTIIYQELFSAINELACVDDHAYNLNAILIYLSFSNFSVPIRKTLQYIYNKMDDQINSQLLSMDNHVFKGFYDLQSIHSLHFAHIILDDIFNIADGRYKLDSDILISRSHLATEIFKILFKDKLSLQHLLSENNVNWVFNFSEELSCTSLRMGQAHISFQELCKDTDFLNFLVRKEVFSEFQISILSEFDFSGDLQPLYFIKPIAQISTDFGSEKTVYTPLFVELLLEFICDKISPQNHPSSLPPLSSSIFPHKPIPEFILKKVLTLFEDSSRPIFFSYDEISFAFQSKDSEFQQSFFKPYLPLTSLMIARCHPQDAKKIYKKWILPNASASWSHDCLLIMANTNEASIEQIGYKVLFLDEFISETYPFPLINRIIYTNPSTVTVWLQKKNILPKHFYRLSRSSSLHALYKFHPKVFHSWIKQNLISIHDLKMARDSFHNSLFHWIASKDPELLEIWIEHGVITIKTLLKNTNKTGNSVLDWLAKFHSHSLELWVQQNKISASDLVQIRNNLGNSVGHRLANFNPQTLELWLSEKRLSVRLLFSVKDIIEESIINCLMFYNLPTFVSLVERGIISVDDLFLDKNKNGQSIIQLLVKLSNQVLLKWLECGRITIKQFFSNIDNNGNCVVHWISKYNPEIIHVWLSQNLISLNHLMDIKNNLGRSILHMMCMNGVEILGDWLHSNIISARVLLNTKDFSNESAMHYLVRHHPKIIEKWVSLNYLTLPELFTTKDSDDKSIIHFLSQFNPMTLELWMNQGKTTIQQLMNHTSLNMTSVIHWLAQHHSETLELWVSQGFTTIQELSECKNAFGYSVIHWLALHNPYTLSLWVDLNIVSIKNVLDLTTMKYKLSTRQLLKKSAPELLKKWIHD